ncbi:MAG: tripartite tricarboxylate transporter TctB family protein [Sphaerochaeta sp.]|nr:tripartite tricarboxylate transporter TctB family protein [Sphaerochaeta sp.]
MKSVKKMFLTKDLYVALVMLVFSGINLWQISTIRIPASRMMPTFTLVVTGASALSLLVRSFMHEPDGQAKLLLFAKKEIIMIIMLLVTANIISVVGFYTSSFLLALGIGLLMETTMTKKTLLAIGLRALILMAVVYIMFSLLLGMYLPRGVLI